MDVDLTQQNNIFSLVNHMQPIKTKMLSGMDLASFTDDNGTPSVVLKGTAIRPHEMSSTKKRDKCTRDTKRKLLDQKIEKD
ncbi:hypothetical protein CTI12_AA443550 [Artemisia annua]|uniref:Uncharacterized protein n=1 Tax=Artemisia annua TaxID=35608 RepID=A0A2U1LXF5_ARTAN|nr:hypothetical protein CTI12_AA443550 [Artemisia annua]